MAFTMASFQLQSHTCVSWKADQWCNASMPRAPTCGSTAAKALGQRLDIGVQGHEDQSVPGLHAVGGQGSAPPCRWLPFGANGTDSSRPPSL